MFVSCLSCSFRLPPCVLPSNRALLRARRRIILLRKTLEPNNHTKYSNFRPFSASDFVPQIAFPPRESKFRHVLNTKTAENRFQGMATKKKRSPVRFFPFRGHFFVFSLKNAGKLGGHELSIWSSVFPPNHAALGARI